MALPRFQSDAVSAAPRKMMKGVGCQAVELGEVYG